MMRVKNFKIQYLVAVSVICGFVDRGKHTDRKYECIGCLPIGCQNPDGQLQYANLSSGWDHLSKTLQSSSEEKIPKYPPPLSIRADAMAVHSMICNLQI